MTDPPEAIIVAIFVRQGRGHLDNMRVTIFGSGYVGLVAAVCLAEVGNDVVCMDVDVAKIEQLQQGKSPIYEPGLSDLLLALLPTGRLTFTTDPKLAVTHGECQFITVGTPSDEEGRADLSYVLQVAKTIAQHMMRYTVIIDKSTVPVGTANLLKGVIAQALQSRHVHIPFDVVSNPEFLKEGAALEDFKNPDRIILGVESTKAATLLKKLYAPFLEKKRIMVMDPISAELTKYAANAMLATKISFMNEMAQLAEKVGADIEKVRQGIAADPRIGPHFTYPGCGYGGSCFGKDIKALIHTAKQNGSTSDIIEAVESVNMRQKSHLFNKISEHFQGNLENKIFAIWGLAFKPQTDDMRDAPSITMIEALLAKGATCQVYDPVANEEAKKVFSHHKRILYCDNPYLALENASALAILTQWAVFQDPDFTKMAENLNAKIIFDGRNIYDPSKLEQLGFIYYGIGRGQALPSSGLENKILARKKIPTESGAHGEKFTHKDG